MADADLLLLNASNYAGQPIFPYAFVQVSAIARSRGLTVARRDLLGVPRQQWPQLVASLIARHRPRMVGFHVRQADSQYLDEYKEIDGSEPPDDPYLPVDDTRTLVEIVRSVTDVPTVAGGFGFSLHAQKMMPFLGTDYGVVGGPDAFFEAFDALAARDLSGADRIGNLLFWRGGEVQGGPQTYFGPLQAPEYDEAILAELVAFYDRHGVALSQDGDRDHADVPVEILRGCPCRCYFCTEPHVKGRKVQARSLDAILTDVAFLADRGVRVLWFICSELNMGGMRFPLELADRMRRFNEGRGDRRILWRAYAMPKPGMTRDQLEILMASGYLPGWNEFVSFDDDNLRACRMPYRVVDAVAYYRTLRELIRDDSLHLGTPLHKFEMFLGNAFMTPETMRTTLEIVDREGFSRDKFYGDSVGATRVYEIDGALTCGTPDQIFSFGPDGRTDRPDTLRPTFHYAPALLEALGGEAEVDAFVAYASRTLLTRNHQAGLDVLGFLTTHTTPPILAAHLRERAELGRLVAQRLRQKRAEHLSPDKRDLIARADAMCIELWTAPDEGTVGALWTVPAPPVLAAAARTLVLVLQGLGSVEHGSGLRRDRTRRSGGPPDPLPHAEAAVPEVRSRRGRRRRGSGAAGAARRCAGAAVAALYVVRQRRPDRARVRSAAVRARNGRPIVMQAARPSARRGGGTRCAPAGTRGRGAADRGAGRRVGWLGRWWRR